MSPPPRPWPKKPRRDTTSCSWGWKIRAQRPGPFTRRSTASQRHSRGRWRSSPRSAAELAIAVAHAFEAPITALYVSGAKRDARGRRGGGSRERAQEQAILKEIVLLAEQYDQVASTRVRADTCPDL